MYVLQPFGDVIGQPAQAALGEHLFLLVDHRLEAASVAVLHLDEQVAVLDPRRIVGDDVSVRFESRVREHLVARQPFAIGAGDRMRRLLDGVRHAVQVVGALVHAAEASGRDERVHLELFGEPGDLQLAQAAADHALVVQLALQALARVVQRIVARAAAQPLLERFLVVANAFMVLGHDHLAGGGERVDGRHVKQLRQVSRRVRRRRLEFTRFALESRRGDEGGQQRAVLRRRRCSAGKRRRRVENFQRLDPFEGRRFFFDFHAVRLFGVAAAAVDDVRLGGRFLEYHAVFVVVVERQTSLDGGQLLLERFRILIFVVVVVEQQPFRYGRDFEAFAFGEFRKRRIDFHAGRTVIIERLLETENRTQKLISHPLIIIIYRVLLSRSEGSWEQRDRKIQLHFHSLPRLVSDQ